MPRKPGNFIDTHIAKRLRLRRKELGISQSALAEGLDIRYQQIQKYEKGTNRVSASQLYEISEQLQVPIQWFFEEIDPRDRGNV